MSYCGGPVSVTFNYAMWIVRYPEFASVSQPLAQLYFDEATLYCANHLNPIRTLPALTTLLNMLTAHIAALNSPITAAGSSAATPPGRLSNVTEGSVTAQFDFEVEPGSQSWYVQTKYGAAFWQATLPYRLFLYRPGPAIKANAFGLASFGRMQWTYGDLNCTVPNS